MTTHGVRRQLEPRADLAVGLALRECLGDLALALADRLGHAQAAGGQPRSRLLAGEEVDGVRDWRRGDPLRLVAWKKSTRTLAATGKQVVVKGWRLVLAEPGWGFGLLGLAVCAALLVALARASARCR